MTEEAKLRTEALRWAYLRDDCNDEYYTCPVQDKCSNYNSVLCDLRTADDLIESLSAELEQVTKAHDAAVKHLLECHKTICPTCIHHTGTGCDKNANAGVDEAVIFCADYEWCGFVR